MRGNFLAGAPAEQAMHSRITIAENLISKAFAGGECARHCAGQACSGQTFGGRPAVDGISRDGIARNGGTATGSE
jgi:hypothetical protein